MALAVVEECEGVLGMGRRPWLSLLLWAAFGAVVAAAAELLLRACGFGPLPLVRWDFCPAPSQRLAAEAQLSLTLRNQADALARELAQKRLACASTPKPTPAPLELPREAGAPRPQQTALLAPPSPPPKPADLPVERWAKKDLSLLEGCWTLGHTVQTVRGGLDSPQREVNCTKLAGHICFGHDGTGQTDTRTSCPIHGTFSCRAPITATFGDGGTLNTTQPRVGCSDGQTYWLPYTMVCRRLSDDLATCRTSSFPGYPARDLEFRRAK